jgi:hypothetical protein
MTNDDKAKLCPSILRDLVRALHGAQVSYPAPRSVEALRKSRALTEALEAAKLVAGEV